MTPRALHTLAALACVALAGGCPKPGSEPRGQGSSPPPSASSSASASGSGDASLADRCAPVVAAATAEPPDPVCRRRKEPLLDAANLVLRAGPQPAPAGGRLDLGTVPASLRELSRTTVDIAPRSFTAVLDRALPNELAAPIAELRAVEARTRETQRRAAMLERAARECPPAESERCACLAQASHDADGTRGERQVERRAAVTKALAALDAWVEARAHTPTPSGSSAPESEAAAAVWTTLGAVRVSQIEWSSTPEAAPDFAPAREALTRALTFAPATSALGFAARYALGVVARDMGDDAAATRAFEELSAAQAPSGVPGNNADVEFYLAELDTTQAGALAHYERAVAQGQAADPPIVATASLYAILARTIGRAEWGRTLSAGTRLVALLAGCDDVGDYWAEIRDGMGRALDRIGPPATGATGQKPQGAPNATAVQVPESAFAHIALGVADAALERGDVAAAAHAWRALLQLAPDAFVAPEALQALVAERRRANDATEAAALEARLARDYGPASAWSAHHKDELAALVAQNGGSGAAHGANGARGRTPNFPPLVPGPGELADRMRDLLVELGSACALREGAPEGSALTVTVDPGLDGRAAVVARAKDKSAASLARCVNELGPGALRGVPLAVTATLAVGP